MVRRRSNSTAVKIAIIGAGSRMWVPEVMRDLALTPQLTGRIALYDINHPGAQRNARLGRQTFAHKDARTTFKVRAFKKLEGALKGADFVLITILPGPMSMMVSDIDIPKKYGVLHAVGDTTGPAGIVRALRCVPIYLSFARRIMAHCPDAWVMNVTNPLTVCTMALYAAEPEIKAFGYCHEVRHTCRWLSQLARERLGVRTCRWQDIEIDIAGLNHFTLATAATWKGHDLFPVLRKHMSARDFFADRTGMAEERKAEGLWFKNDKLIAFDFLRRFGVCGAAGDRHLAEFVPWYLTGEAALHRWGVVLTPTSWRVEDAAAKAARKLAPPERLKPSGSEIVPELLGLAGVRDYCASTNIPNRGQIAGLPMSHVVETVARYTCNAVLPQLPKALPPMANNLVLRIAQVQQATLDAGIKRDKDLAFQAVLNDPLMQISTDQAWKMFSEMLLATRPMLPGWRI